MKLLLSNMKVIVLPIILGTQGSDISNENQTKNGVISSDGTEEQDEHLNRFVIPLFSGVNHQNKKNGRR